MRIVGVAALAAVAAVAAIALLAVFVRPGRSSGSAPSRPVALAATAGPPTPTPIPRTWMDGLTAPHSGEAVLISCFDTNRDGTLDALDGENFAGLHIELIAGEACQAPALHRDYYAGAPSDEAAFACVAGKPAPLLIVAVASAGSDLLAPAEGESLGLPDIVNALQARAAERGITTLPVITMSAIFGAEPPQTSMERWIARQMSRFLDRLPCLRAVILGHSHGGVTVTSVAAALDADYSSRLFGVAIDRTIVLYDRPAGDMPERTQILNVFQLNEGWHGLPIDLPNVINDDESSARAPIAPSDGGGATTLVSHKTLDDSPGVQRRIEDAVMSWLEGHP